MTERGCDECARNDGIALDEFKAPERPVPGPGFPGPDDTGIPCPGQFPDPDATSTNAKYLFLREIGGAGCLKGFLDQVLSDGEDGAHWGGTLILDELVDLADPITIPSNFTLAGVGIHGNGGLRIANDLSGPNPKGVAVTFAPGGNSVLRDLTIEAKVGEGFVLGKPDALGVAFNTGPIYIDAVRVFGLKIGLLAVNARAIYMSNCSFDGNALHIELRGACKHCRIRDSDLRFGAVAAIIIRGPKAEDTLIHGCQFEGNGETIFPLKDRCAISIDDSFGTFIFGNRFESNGSPVSASCIRVSNTLVPDPNGTAVRFLCNLTAEDQPRPGEFNEPMVGVNTLWPQEGDALQYFPLLTQTHIGFNSSLDWSTQQGIKPLFPMNQVNAPTVLP